MIALALALCLALASAAGDDPVPPPPLEEVVAACTAVKEALRSEDVVRIQGALQAASAVPHATVVETIARALADERPEVRLAALQALRHIQAPEAVDVLEKAAKDRALMKDPELAAALLRALGQHARPSSIGILERTPFEPDTRACKRARLFGLARIRTPEALEALFGILAVGGNVRTGERRIQAQMADVRIALWYATGVDRGLVPELWEDWWRENRRHLELPEEPAKLPEALQREWDLFWGLRPDYERRERREDRGR